MSSKIRNSLFSLLVTGVSIGSAYSQSILFEACLALPSPQQQLTCIQAPGFSPETVRAAVANILQGSLSKLPVKPAPTLERTTYQAAVEELSAALQAAKPTLSTQASQAIKPLESALKAHQDALEFWSATDTFYQKPEMRVAYPYAVPVRLLKLQKLQALYEIPGANADLWGNEIGVNFDRARLMIWQQAQKYATEGIDHLQK